MLSPNIKGILWGLTRHKESDIYNEDRGPLVDVNRLTGKMGAFYEKLRYTVDYKENHTIERSAIERILNRGIFVEGNQNLGVSLLQELVGGGYLPNKKVPEAVAYDLQGIIDKYLMLDDGQIGNSKLTSLIAAEIEILLHPQTLDNLVTESLYKTVSGNIDYRDSVSQETLDIQTYIGCRRSLLEDDYDSMLYAVLIKYMPELPTLVDEDEIQKVAPYFSQMVQQAEEDIKHPLGWKISSRLKKYSVNFSIIKEIIHKYGVDAESVFSNEEQLEAEIRDILSKKYKYQEELVSRSGTRAVIYLLITKIILALILELPYEIFVLNHINFFALGTNIIFHPIVLLLMVKTTSPSTSKNTDLIVSGIKEIVNEEQDIKKIHIKGTSGDFYMQVLFGAFYLVLFGISFGIIVSVLTVLQFNSVSILLFIFFLTLISSFGFRIRTIAKKWQIPAENERFFSLLWSLFTMPIIKTGRWLSRRFATVNIFVFFMDFILETPFKFILGTFDSFISFLKDKEEDTY